jgi:hypothetical protein
MKPTCTATRSTPHANHVRVLHARDCYSAPEDVYRVAKARGMDLVCLTDHDSLDGGLSWLDAHPDATDFILGEEIGCRVPDAPGLRVHLGAIGMTERVHREVQSLRSNAFDVAEYLRQERVFFSVNHLFLLFRDELPIGRYVRDMLALSAPGLEVHNGAASEPHNALVAAIAERGAAAAGRCRRSGQRRPHAAVGRHGIHRNAGAHARRNSSPICTPAHATGGRLGDALERFGNLRGRRTVLGIAHRPERWSPRPRASRPPLSAMLLPFQFVPAVVAFRLKASEATRVGVPPRCLRPSPAGIR